MTFHEDSIDDRLPARYALTLVHEITRTHDIGDAREKHRQQERTECEPEDHASTKPQGSHAVVWRRYPRPRTVTRCCGLDASRSSFTRSRRTVTSTSRSSPDDW